jgi:hypothetical protein
MSHPDDAEPVEQVDGDEAEVMLADPDDYHQAQRLREIHQARRQVHKEFTDIDPYTKEADHATQRGQLGHAVTAYLVELLPVFRDAGIDTSLPHALPWDNFGEYVTTTGFRPGENEYCGYQSSMIVFETANQRFAEVKPLVESDDPDEWEVEV